MEDVEVSKCDPAANVKLEEPIDSPRKKASEIQQIEVNKYYTSGRLESRKVKEEWKHKNWKDFAERTKICMQKTNFGGV